VRGREEERDGNGGGMWGANKEGVSESMCVLLCRQSWLEERKVLTERVEECQTRQMAVSEKLAESRKEAKKVMREDK
jgi:hypothetical protein